MYTRQWLRSSRLIPPATIKPLYNDTGASGINIVVLQLYLIYDRTTAPEGLRRGLRIHLKNEVSDSFWKSDFDYAKLDAQFEMYGYFRRTYPSLVLRSVLNYPTSTQGVPLTQLLRAGGADLRGYLATEFHGDTLLSLQIEEQAPVFHGLPVPWTRVKLNVAFAVFTDMGALLERHPGGRINSDPTMAIAPRPELRDFHTSVGAGLRILVPGVAIPALKIDYAYGIDVNDAALTVSVAGGGL
jgi:outer membrane protein assembly factor BamA